MVPERYKIYDECRYSLLTKFHAVTSIFPKKYTPLLLACSQRNCKTMRLLVEHDADMNSVPLPTVMLSRPWEPSVVKIVQTLLDWGVNVNDDRGWA